VIALRGRIREIVPVSAWTRRGLVAATAVLALSGTASALAATSSSAAPAPVPALVEPALVEAAACAAPTPLVAPDGSRTDGETVVSFQVPALTRLRVDGGAVVAVATNTGCAPQATDRFVVDDRFATPAEVDAALAVRTGDWTTPGAWHPIG